jgi:saccharopine dehydrogenase-like NADP-dependent oxidoreductase
MAGLHRARRDLLPYGRQTVMTTRVLVIGGYGNFGTLIVRRLAREPNLAVVIAGRSECKARTLAGEVNAEWAQVDIFDGFDAQLRSLRPDILIHTSGPFQEQGYEVAETCIRNGVHYLDLADGRAFVCEIARLDQAAKAAGVLVVSGASTVPGLTSAVVTRYASEFSSLDAIDFGIGTAQKTNRGIATVKAILGYAGKPFKTLVDGKMNGVWLARYSLAKIP